MVADLSDLRRQLFAGSIHPTALMVLTQQRTPPGSGYEFAYLAPKADPNLALRRFVSLSSSDRATLRSSEILKNPRLFKERLRLRAPEVALFRYLAGPLPSISDFLERNVGQEAGTRWTIGHGFQAWHGRPSGGPKVSSIVGRIRLPADRSLFTPQDRRFGFDALAFEPSSPSLVSSKHSAKSASWCPVALQRRRDACGPPM